MFYSSKYNYYVYIFNNDYIIDLNNKLEVFNIILVGNK